MTQKERIHLYEGMYILNPNLSEDAAQKALERITKDIETHGGEVHKVHSQGKRKLAYEVANARQGYYFVLYFSVGSRAITEIWKEYKLNEDLLRFVTLRAPCDFKSALCAGKNRI